MKSNLKKNVPLSSLDDRSRKILQYVVESYIENGNPVASKVISKKINPTLASATIRNVMAKLERLDLLRSPHISAGRIPTDTGLQFFVDGLLQFGDVPSKEKENIESLCAGLGKSLKEILLEASDALSGLSKCVSLVAAPNIERPVKHIDFVPVDNERALVIIVNSLGMVENRLIDNPKGTPVANLIEASNYLNSKIMGQTLLESKKSIQEDLNNHRKEIDVISEKVIKAGLAIKSGNSENPTFILTGKDNIYNNLSSEGDIDRINFLFEELEKTKISYQLIENAVSKTGVHVFIGSDNKLFDHSGCSMIIAPLKGKKTIESTETKTLGAIGVIGPKRVNYARVIPIVDFTAKTISKLFE